MKYTRTHVYPCVHNYSTPAMCMEVLHIRILVVNMRTYDLPDIFLYPQPLDLLALGTATYMSGKLLRPIMYMFYNAYM